MLVSTQINGRIAAPPQNPCLSNTYVGSQKGALSPKPQVLVGCHVYNEATDSRPGGEELITKFLIDIALIYGEAFIG